MSLIKNHCVKLAKRPGVSGEPLEEHFYYSECLYPELSSSTGDAEVEGEEEIENVCLF